MKGKVHLAKYETLIFILEGSLLNEKVAELNALSQTLKLAGREYGPAERIRYNSLHEKIKLLGFDERIKLTLQEFFKNDWISAKGTFDNQLQKQDQLNKDVLPFLDEVQNKVNLILLTKEKKDVASSRMQSTELLNYFSAVYFKDDFACKFPDKKVLTTILQLLKNGPMSAGDIANHFNMTKATISYHLNMLKKADLIEEEHEKNFIYYSLNTSIIEEIMGWLVDLKGDHDEKE